MFTTIALVVIVLVGALLAYAAVTGPNALHVQRAARINAPPGKIFPLINDFHSWSAWSPYETRDPALKKVFIGATSGVGSVYEWVGNRQVGEGRMEITGTSHPSRITIKLDFIKPFEGHNVAEFTLVPNGDTTTVTWTMDGPSRFITKVMSVFINLDTMIGRDFEIGLAKLKAIAEQ